MLARVGRPADKPITDRVTEATRYRKLTAELVRRGLTSLGLASINSAVAKDPKAISFPTDIHRDGPGHLAIIDLPYGVEAADVVARRGKLASARIDRELVGRNVIAGRWTFQIVEDYDDGYYAKFRELERLSRESLASGRRHLHEAK